MPGVGVDIVDLARIAASSERAPGRLAGRLCSDAEQAWIGDGDGVERLAACFALKEAWIKANGRRPEGFHWSAYEYDPATSTIAGQPAMWSRVDDTVLAVVGRAAVAVGASATVGSVAHTAQRSAGRIAATAAIAALVGAGHRVEIVPGEHPPDEPQPCRGSHPPRVVVDGEPSTVEVTITHGRTIAAAIAWIA